MPGSQQQHWGISWCKGNLTHRYVDDTWVIREPDEVVVVRVATKVRCTECKTVVSARVDHPAEADVQCAEAKLSVAEQVEDGSLLRLRCRLLLGHHRGDHLVHFPLVENHLVSLGHLLDLLLCLTILTLEIFGLPRLSQYNPGRHLWYLPPDGFRDDPPVGEEEETGEGEDDLQQLPVGVEQVGNLKRSWGGETGEKSYQCHQEVTSCVVILAEGAGHNPEVKGKLWNIIWYTLVGYYYPIHQLHWSCFECTTWKWSTWTWAQPSPWPGRRQPRRPH